LFHAPIDVVAEHTSPTAGPLEKRDDRSCLFYAGAASLDQIAVYVALKDIDFRVLEPPELRDHVRTLTARLSRAGDDSGWCGRAR
jgi:hypothetical protein